MNHRTEERRLRAYARAAAALSAYEPSTAVEDRLDAEALGPMLALALADLSPAPAVRPAGDKPGGARRCRRRRWRSATA